MLKRLKGSNSAVFLVNLEIILCIYLLRNRRQISLQIMSEFNSFHDGGRYHKKPVH